MCLIDFRKLNVFVTSQIFLLLFLYQRNCLHDLRYVDYNDDDYADDKKPKAGNNSDSEAAEFSFSSRHKTKGDKNSDTDLDKISACPLCHLALPIKTLEWHEVVYILILYIYAVSGFTINIKNSLFVADLIISIYI